MRCSVCDHVITAEKKRKTSPDGTVREYSYYRCSQYNRTGHPRVRLPERAINDQFLDLFDRLHIASPEVREWIKEVIRARAGADREQNAQHRAELERQKRQVEAKLKTLLDLRMDGEITADDYSDKRAELHERESAIRLQLETTDLDDRQVADLAIAAFELSQSLKNRWKNADYTAKRTILEILCQEVRLNCEKLEISLRKPFDSLIDGDLVSKSGAGGNRTTPFSEFSDASGGVDAHQNAHEQLAEIVCVWASLPEAFRAAVHGMVRSEAENAFRQQTHGSFAHESSDTPDGRSHARTGVPCEHGRGVDRRGSGAEGASERSAAECGLPAPAATRQGPSPSDSQEVLL
ncbi:MAG: hypothetical protein ACIAQF_11345 [Phycisphaerales bacterium JB065]